MNNGTQKYQDLKPIEIYHSTKKARNIVFIY